jgi:hypothetical protein
VPLSDGAAGLPNRSISDIKAYIDARRAAVLGQIQQNYTQTTTGNAADSLEGYKVTTTGAVSFAGTFHVAKTYSVTVNGVPAQWFYRTSGPDAAGTWRFATAVGGSGVLQPGLNRVVIRFWDGINGTGHVLQEFFSDVLYSGGTGTTVSGVLSTPGSLAMTAPDCYVPGVPILVRVDLRDAAGNPNRSAWNSTATLTATNGVALNPSTVSLYNGMGSALVTVGGTTGGGAINYFSYGTGGTGGTAANTGVPGSTWKGLYNLTAATIPSVPTTWKDEGFDDSAWASIVSQTGYGNNDENRAFARLDTDGNAANGVQGVPSYLFRNTFTIADITQLTSVTGQIKYDDGFAIYVNGVDLSSTVTGLRSANLPAGTALSAYATAPSVDNATTSFTIPLTALHNGVNTIAVEIHQGSPTSGDVTFDLRLQGNTLSSVSDPGNFTLGANLGALAATRAVTSLGAAAGTTVSGSLTGANTWSGLVRVTGDVTVPAGASLTIAAGAHILMAGTSGGGDTGGADLIVNGGTLSIGGTAAQPVSITADSSANRWGQILLNGAQPTVASFLLMSRGGHAPGVGHTGRGPLWRLTGSHLTFNDSACGDGPAKALYSSGTCDFVMQRSLMARMITGPETEDGTSILIEDSNIQEILPNYRESNAAAPDDEDCLYVHNGSGRPVNVRRTVFARCGDDVFDCLGGPINVEDSILREGWDKGMSLLNNTLTITRTLIVDCDKAIVPKSQNATVNTTTVSRCTIFSENHNTTLAPWGYSIPPNSPDADSPSTGLYTQNKSGQSNAGATMVINAVDCIILAESPILIDAPYSAANTVVTYSITRDTDTPATAAWTGTGNSNDDPLFVNLATDDYHLATGSPAINTGDPALFDPDGSRSDMGALPTGVLTGGGGAVGEITWTLAGSPYRVTANSTVPVGATLRINAGVNVQFDEGIRLTVNGRLLAEGTPARRITFSHVPGTNVTDHDVDLIKNLVQNGAPKWGGVRIINSMAQENVVKYADFINAQGLSASGVDNQGSLGFVRSWGYCEGLTFAGSHLRLLYGRNPKLTIIRCTFPDMMRFDPVLGRIEDNTDFITSADNNMEPLKVEYPVDADSTGAAWSSNGLPIGGWWRVYYNQFNGNRGHNDVFDADSGRVNVVGDFLLDCRYNHFRGLSGDEHIDLGGDAYIASNIFEAATKDEWVSAFGTDNGYSNAISSGDKGDGTTIMVVRNTCYDLDHVINCKARTATIFEHNTVSGIHADYLYTPSTPDQNVKCAPINFFVPEDGANPTRGDGAYMGYNLISNTPRLFSGPDARKTGGTTIVNDVTTEIDFFHNMLDQIGDPTIGPNHPGGIFGGTYGPNVPGLPSFIDPASENYGITIESAARSTAPGGLNYGADIPEWAYLLGGPPANTTATTATWTVGGPGIVSYKWRLNGGPWSAEEVIGTGSVFPRDIASPATVIVTSRQEALTLTGLAPGTHTLEVLGRDMAGNWQDNDPARTLIGAPQATPTTRTWTIGSARLELSEIRAASATGQPDAVELCFTGATALDLAGWSLSDDPLLPGKFPLDGQTAAPNSCFLATTVGLALDADGDSVYLYENGVLRDAITFGPQIADMTLARAGTQGAWGLATPTFGAANTLVRLGDPGLVRLSEWLVSGGECGPDWIELYNGSTLPVLMSGLVLSDGRFGTGSVIPPYSYIAAGGYATFLADSRAMAEGNHLTFALDGVTSEILLLAANQSVQDVVRYFPQITGVSQGRVPTGGVGGLSFFDLPTSDFANTTTLAGYANALALRNGLRITEVMYHPAGGNNFEFLEFTNIGSVALDLSGVQITEGVEFTFPIGFMLAPGAQTVVVRNLAVFQSRYGTALNVAGAYVGALDNNGETLTVSLPSPPWASEVQCFRYESSWQDTNVSGLSLTLRSNATVVSDFDRPEMWTASLQLNGTPAGWIPLADPHPNGLAAWLTAYGLAAGSEQLDADFDGLTNALEYTLNSHPLNPHAGHGADRLPTPSVSGDGFQAIAFDLPSSALAGGHGCPGTTYTIAASTNLGVWTTVAKKSPTDATWTDATGASLAVGQLTATVNGPFVRIVCKDAVPVAMHARRYLRLAVTIDP